MDSIGGILLASLGLLVLAVLGFLAVTWARNRFRVDPGSDNSAGFSLSDLRALHKTGQISDEEFERTRAQIIAASQKASDESAAREQQAG